MSDGVEATGALSPEDKAALDKAIADARKAQIAADEAAFDLQQKKLAALVPDALTKPLEGKVTVGEDAGYLAELAAYSATERCAKDLARVVKEAAIPDGSVILLAESPDMAAADAVSHQVKTQLDAIRSQLVDQRARLDGLLAPPETRPEPKAEARTFAPAAVAAVLPEVASLGLTAAVGTIGAVADLIGYFRSDYEIKGRTVSISDSAARVLTAHALKSSEKKLRLVVQGQQRLEFQGVMADFADGLEKRRQLSGVMEKLKAQRSAPLSEQLADLHKHLDADKSKLEKLKRDTDLSAAIKDLEESIAAQEGQQKSLQKEKAEFDAAVAEAASTISLWEEFAKIVTAVPSAESMSPLATAALQAQLGDVTHLLHVSVVSTGGEMVIGRSLFANPDCSIIGGTVLTYCLSTKDGEVVAAGAVSATSCSDFKLGRPGDVSFKAKALQ